jgi:hypothetical protein
MKVIDLLNKWLNNELMPKTIVYGNDLFYWNENLKDYTTSLDPNVIDSNTYFMEQLHFGRLNNEVKIIEEDKKIEKLKNITKLPKVVNHNSIDWFILEELEKSYKKINELIDEVNKLKNKEEK